MPTDCPAPQCELINKKTGGDREEVGEKKVRVLVLSPSLPPVRGPVVMFCLPFWAMNDGDADDNAADARDVSLKGGCLIPFVAGLCC